MIEAEVEDYLCERITENGGRTRKIQYVGLRGASDQLVGLFGRLYIVEVKRPSGGVISIHQSKDAEAWAEAGIEKVYLKTKAEVDTWLRMLNGVDLL